MVLRNALSSELKQEHLITFTIDQANNQENFALCHQKTTLATMSSENPAEKLAESLVKRLAGPSSGKAGSVP